jgi:hypothetical protein
MQYSARLEKARETGGDTACRSGSMMLQVEGLCTRPSICTQQAVQVSERVISLTDGLQPHEDDAAKTNNLYNAGYEHHLGPRQ